MEKKIPLQFRITGDFLTKFFREMYYTNKTYDEVKELMIDSLNLNKLDTKKQEEIIYSILNGYKRLEGINEYNIVNDNDFDVYEYINFPRPSFRQREKGKGLRGILTVSGLFIECEYMGHASAILKLGQDKAAGAISFFINKVSDGIAKDKSNDIFTHRQIEWVNKHLDYLTSNQVNVWNMLLINDNFLKGKNEVYERESII